MYNKSKTKNKTLLSFENIKKRDRLKKTKNKIPDQGRKRVGKMDMMKNTARDKAMLDLFNAVANAQYLYSTSKTYEELREYLAKHANKWSEVAVSSDFYSIQDCIEAARDVALRVVDKENFRRFFDSLDNTILKS